MIIHTLPNKVGPRVKRVCRPCDKAWHLYLKGTALQKRSKKKEWKKSLLRKGRWYRILAAKVLFRHRKKHIQEPRACPLIIHGGEATKIYQVNCWNCQKLLYASKCKFNEMPFCKHCQATMYQDWILGTMETKVVIERMKKSINAPYTTDGLWEDFRWSKKAKDIVRRKS